MGNDGSRLEMRQRIGKDAARFVQPQTFESGHVLDGFRNGEQETVDAMEQIAEVDAVVWSEPGVAQLLVEADGGLDQIVDATVELFGESARVQVPQQHSAQHGSHYVRL